MENNEKIILIVEDDAGLNELVSEKIEGCGYKTISVQTANSGLEWLKGNSPFLIVLDYGLPEMNGKEFITDLKKNGINLPPFIISTGQGDERIAVEMMKLGARDYIIKDTNFLDMLPLMVCRVCLEIENEKKLILVEKELTELNKFNKKIIDSAQEGIVVIDTNMNCQLWNPHMERITGILASEIIGKSAEMIIPVEEKSKLLSMVQKALNGEDITENDFVFNFPTAETPGWLSITISQLTNSMGEAIGGICTIHDITERKTAEETLANKVNQLQNMNRFMVDREIRMVGMKKEVNELLVRLGEEKRYN